MTAQGMETRSAETGTGSVRQDDSPVAESDAPNPVSNTPTTKQEEGGLGALRERVAVELAASFGYSFDDTHLNKRHWSETGGILNDLYRDVNDLRQDDYLDAADAIIPMVLEEAALYLDGYAGGHYMAQSCAAVLREIAKPNPPETGAD